MVAGSSPPMCSTPSRGAVEEGEYAGAAQHTVLREGHDLDGQRTVVGGDGLTHGLDAAQLEPQIDVDVRADRGGAVAHELLEDIAGDLCRRHPDLVAVGPLVTDAALGRVHGGVVGRRRDRADHPAGDAEIDRVARVRPQPDVANDIDVSRGGAHASILPVQPGPETRDNVEDVRAYGAVGSAPRSHRGGQEFESP